MGYCYFNKNIDFNVGDFNFVIEINFESYFEKVKREILVIFRGLSNFFYTRDEYMNMVL